MVVRISKAAPPSWSAWADRFVRGGLGLPSPPGGPPTGGGAPSSARVHRRGPHRGRPKFSVRFRPPRQLVRLHDSPLLSTREGEAYRADLARASARWVPRTVERLAVSLGGWPHWGVQRKIRALALRPLGLSPPVRAGGIHVGFPRVELVQRGGFAHLRWAVHLGGSTHTRGFRPRWGSEFNPGRDHHHLRRRWVWAGLARSWLGAYRPTPAAQVGRARREFRRTRREAGRIRRQRRYRRWRRRLPRRVAPGRRRRWWSRRRRLERFAGFPGPAGWTRSRLVRAQPSRWARLEEVALVRPPRPYLQEVHAWSTPGIGRRVGSPWEYTYTKSFGFYGAFVTRRTHRGKRWKLQDHPSARTPFLEERRRRWSWFGEGSLARAIRSGSDRFDPTDHPRGGGVESGFYWSTQAWGRGSRWKTKPVRRALASFVRGLRTGWGVDPDAVQWNHAATAATGVRHSLLGEQERPPPRLVAPGPATRSGWSPIRVDPPRRSSFGWAVWFGVFTPLWHAYRSAARVWSLVWFFSHWSVRAVRVVFGFPWVVLREWVSPGWRWWCHHVRSTVVDHPRWRTVRWVYLAWLLAYSSEDNQYELERQSPDEEDADYYFQEETDPAGEASEDADELGTNSFRHRPPTWWDGWFQREFDSFYDEGRELVWTLTMEEVPYYVRLLTHPVVDFFFRLPFWGLLEGALALVAAVGRDLQRGWVRWLARPGGGRFLVVLLGRSGRWVGWALLFWWVQSQLDYGALKFWVTYSLGVTFHEEYYLGWLLLCGGATAAAAAPPGVRRFFRADLGWANLVFLWAAFTGLTFPEDYYPTRPTPQIRAWVHDRTFLVWHKLVVRPDGAERIYPHGALTQPDWDDRVWAQLRGWNEPVWEPEVDDLPFASQLLLPHPEELPRPGWYPHLDPPGWGVDPRRTNTYEVEFGPELGPNYLGWTSRAERTDFTRPEDF